MVKIKITDKLALGSLTVMVVTFPATGQYVLLGLDWLFAQIFLYAGWIFAVTSLYAVVWTFSKVFVQEPVKSLSKAKKSVKTPSMQYIET